MIASVMNGVPAEMDSLPNGGGAVGLKQFHIAVMRAWERAREWNRFQWIDAAGLLGLYLFSFGVFYRTLLVHEGLVLMALAFALRLKTLEKGVLREPLFILSVAFLMFLLIRTYYTATEFKDYQSLIFEGMLKSIQFGFFVVFVVGFWMNRHPGRWNELIIALFTGHLVRVLRNFDWNTYYEGFDHIWNGATRLRVGSTVNRFGLWSAVILFGCVILYRHIWGSCTQNYKFIYWSRIFFWALVTILAGAGLVFSQSRSAWLAAVLVTPLILFYQFYPMKKFQTKPAVIIGVLLVVLSFMTNLPVVVEKRLFLSTNLSDNDNIEERLLLYRLFWERWKERPWFGYGPGTSEIIIKQAGGEHAEAGIREHFHNFALDIMVHLGIVGILFYSSSFYLIFRQLFFGQKLGCIDRNYFWFALVGLILMIICGLFGQPFTDYKGAFLFGFLGGICYASKFSIQVITRQGSMNKN
jgi:hypothetical protein